MESVLEGSSENILTTSTDKETEAQGHKTNQKQNRHLQMTDC